VEGAVQVQALWRLVHVSGVGPASSGWCAERASVEGRVRRRSGGRSEQTRKSSRRGGEA
jgi:hypothetical protein